MRRLGIGSTLECWMKKQSAGSVTKFPGTLLSAMKRDSGAVRTPPSRADMLQNCWFSRAGGSSGIAQAQEVMKRSLDKQRMTLIRSCYG